MAPRLADLHEILRGYGSVLVCFSGGVDSALVLAAATQALGDRAVGLTTISASLPAEERASAVELAGRLGSRHILVESTEISDPRYAANPVNRCFYCKSELYTVAVREAAALDLAVIVNGTNLDDLGDHRPGLDAAREAGVRSPLVELGLTKEGVRALAKEAGLPVWDKPAAACLSSRIPYGTSVTVERLAQIDRAESAIRKLGLRQVRVRFHDKVARVEVSENEIDQAFALRREVAAACKSAGFSYATLDLEGYRMGSHNEVVKLKVLNG